MAITVRIPQPLQNLTGGDAEVTAEGGTVQKLLGDLEKKHPGIRERVLDDAGKQRRFVNIYLNDEDIRFLENLDSPLSDGDIVSIVPAVAGGVTPGEPGNDKKKFYLTFAAHLIQRPLLWEASKKFEVIPNIRTASVGNDIGLMAVEFEGPSEEIEKARDWLQEQGLTVEPVELNVIE